jgi:hypothetical protein
MGLNHSPKIVTNGLVLCLDAGNTKSYSGSGTTWTDLSGRGNSATMFGSVPFETDTAQCFNFATATGVSSAASTLGFTFASNMVQTTGDFTISCWIKNPNTSSAQVGLFSNAGSADGYRFGIGTDGIYFLIGPNYTEGTVTFTSSLSASVWHNVVAVYDRTVSYNIRLFRNGIYNNAASIPTSQTAFTNATPGIVRSACCGVYTGKLANFKVYNKALSASEIEQNFNALRGRFGI